MGRLFWGSIGGLAETSHLQLQSFNDAFAGAGLDWVWSGAAYREMVARSGGRSRIATYAQSTGQEVDADALHASKSDLFRQRLAARTPPREGGVKTLQAARANGWWLAVVTTTSPANVDAVLTATGLSRGIFDLVTDTDTAIAAKPDPAAYSHALGALGLSADAVTAVADNPEGLRAALAAGLRGLAVPGAFHHPDTFDGAAVILSRRDLPQDPMAT